MLIRVALGATLLLAAAATSISPTPFIFDVSAEDPVVWFTPVGSRNGLTGGDKTKKVPTGPLSLPPGVGWELTLSPLPVPAPAVINYTVLASRTPKRSSSYASATVSLSFVGTGVVFWGNRSSDAAFSATIDGTQANTADSSSVLLNVTGVQYGQHHAELTLLKGSVDFHSASILTSLQTDGITADQVKVTTAYTLAQDTKFNPVFTLASTDKPWYSSTLWGGAAWYYIGVRSENATMEYAVPANTSFLALYGGTSSNSGDYHVSFTPNLMYPGAAARGSLYSWFTRTNVLLWAGPLDPTTKYNMTLMSLLSDWSMDVSHVRTWSAVNGSAASDTLTKESSNTAGIVGGAVGGGIAALAIIALVIVVLRRRKSTKPQLLDIIDDDHNMNEYQSRSVIGHNMDPPPLGEQHDILTPFPTVAATATSGIHSQDEMLAMPTKSRYTPHNEIIRQETDAETVVKVVPPSYDPQWASASGGRV